jgi:hypothetical protein
MLLTIAAVLVLPLACRGNTRPPPPCEPSPLSEARATATVRAWVGWAPLRAWELRSVQLDGCLDEAGNDTMSIEVLAPAAEEQQHLEHHASIRFKVGSKEGAPAAPAEIAAEVKRLATNLPAASRAASADPVVAAWRGAHKPRKVTYQLDPKPPGHCLSYAAAAGAPPPQLKWCEPGGVVRVTLSAALELPFEPARRLRAGLRAAASPDEPLIEAELQRWRHGRTPAWRASGSLGRSGAKARSFEAKQGPGGEWKVSLGPKR